MPATEDRAISEFPRALQLLATALIEVSNPDGLGAYDTNSVELTELGRVILGVQYTQQLGNVSVFDAIKNTRVLSGTTTPTANEGANGQLYVKYETVSNIDTVIGMYFKKDGAWLEISLGGGGGADYVECTQAQYDAWEQAGTLDPTVMYFITDGQSGGCVVIDDTTTAQDKVWSSEKVAEELGDTHIVKTNINPSVVPTGHITKNATEIHDVNDSQVLRLEAYQAASTGNVRGQIVVSRPVGGTTNLNYLYLGIKPNGDKEVFVSADAEWRNALNVPEKLKIGTDVRNFSNGVVDVPLSSYGLSSKPNCVLLTPARGDVIMAYDWDQSSATNGLRITCRKTNDLTGVTGNVRFSIAILA